MEMVYSVRAALIDVIHALIILFLITTEFIKSCEIDITVERKRATRSPARWE